VRHLFAWLFHAFVVDGVLKEQAGSVIFHPATGIEANDRVELERLLH
jgi:hypothetical protein